MDNIPTSWKAAGISAVIMVCLFFEIGRTDGISVRLFDTQISTIVPHRVDYDAHVGVMSAMVLTLVSFQAKCGALLISTQPHNKVVFGTFAVCVVAMGVIASVWVPMLSHAAHLNGPPNIKIETKVGPLPYVALIGSIAAKLLLAANRVYENKTN